jgi:ubiquinone biosynthesis accessory factor UbiJ
MQALNSAAIGALNHLIQGEPWAQARLYAHSGAQVRIDAGLFVLNLGIDERGLFQASEKGLESDVSITLPSDLPVRLLIDHRNLFSSVKLGGSADIAESLAFVLRNLRWDAEADLAQLLGDIPARRLARLGKALASAIQDALGRAAQNFSEYVVEESHLLSASRDITQFIGAVNILRDDVARLEKRISRL